MLLHQKTCLITGGGSGIGRAAAIRLAEEGASIWIAGDQEGPLKETSGLIGAQCEPRICNISDSKAVDFLISELPQLDVLVCNAAVNYSVDLASDSFDRWKQMLDVNLWGTLHCCMAGGRRMIQKGTGGRIVLISSVLDRVVTRL